jgi:hypothetical protein
MSFGLENDGIPVLEDVEVAFCGGSGCIPWMTKRIGDIEPNELKNVTFNFTFSTTVISQSVHFDLYVNFKELCYPYTYGRRGNAKHFGYMWFLFKGLEGKVIDIIQDKPFYLPGDNVTLTFVVEIILFPSLYLMTLHLVRHRYIILY